MQVTVPFLLLHIVNGSWKTKSQACSKPADYLPHWFVGKYLSQNDVLKDREAYSTLIGQHGVANITMQLDHKNQSTGWWDPCYAFSPSSTGVLR